MRRRPVARAWRRRRLSWLTAPREKALAAAEAALRARVADDSAELRVASRGYDEELARVGAELASLQASLAARETSVERMQSRMDAEARSETSKRQMEISDARVRTVEDAGGAGEDGVRRRAQEGRRVEARGDAERRCARWRRARRARRRASPSWRRSGGRWRRASKRAAPRRGEAARAELEEASRLVGVSPREVWRPSPISENTAAANDYADYAPAKLETVAARLEARVASRRDDARAAQARGAAALAAKVSAEVQELEAYLEAVTASLRREGETRAVSARAGSEAASARARPRPRRRRWRRGSLTWRKSSR